MKTWPRRWLNWPPRDAFSVCAIDIDVDAQLEQAYGARVPVLMLADRLICEYFLNPHALQQALSEHLDD